MNIAVHIELSKNKPYEVEQLSIIDENYHVLYDDVFKLHFTTQSEGKNYEDEKKKIESILKENTVILYDARLLKYLYIQPKEVKDVMTQYSILKGIFDEKTLDFKKQKIQACFKEYEVNPKTNLDKCKMVLLIHKLMNDTVITYPQKVTLSGIEVDVTRHIDICEEGYEYLVLSYKDKIKKYYVERSKERYKLNSFIREFTGNVKISNTTKGYVGFNSVKNIKRSRNSRPYTFEFTIKNHRFKTIINEAMNEKTFVQDALMYLKYYYPCFNNGDLESKDSVTDLTMLDIYQDMKQCEILPGFDKPIYSDKIGRVKVRRKLHRGSAGYTIYLSRNILETEKNYIISSYDEEERCIRAFLESR